MKEDNNIHDIRINTSVNSQKPNLKNKTAIISTALGTSISIGCIASIAILAQQNKLTPVIGAFLALPLVILAVIGTASCFKKNDTAPSTTISEEFEASTIIKNQENFPG